MPKLSILDMTSAQAELVEELSELPLDEWGSASR